MIIITSEKYKLHQKHEQRKNKQRSQGYAYRHKDPSTVYDIYWIYASCKDCSYPEASERSGKWIISTPNAEIDAKWKVVKEATLNGKLGKESKVSTMKINPIAKNLDEKVICVYTYDWTDKQDVFRIRGELKILGFNSPIFYKTDEDTMKGKYSWKGDNVAKYRE